MSSDTGDAEGQRRRVISILLLGGRQGRVEAELNPVIAHDLIFTTRRYRKRANYLVNSRCRQISAH